MRQKIGTEAVRSPVGQNFTALEIFEVFGATEVICGTELALLGRPRGAAMRHLVSLKWSNLGGAAVSSKGAAMRWFGSSSGKSFLLLVGFSGVPSLGSSMNGEFIRVAI